MKALFALALGGAALAGCAAANPGGEAPAEIASHAPDACFGTGDVNVVNEQTLYVATRRGYVYRLDAPGACYVQGASVSVGALNGGICTGNQARVAVGGPLRGPAVQCIAKITGPYTDSRKSGLWSRPAAS